MSQQSLGFRRMWTPARPQPSQKLRQDVFWNGFRCVGNGCATRIGSDRCAVGRILIVLTAPTQPSVLQCDDSMACSVYATAVAHSLFWWHDFLHPTVRNLGTASTRSNLSDSLLRINCGQLACNLGSNRSLPSTQLPGFRRSKPVPQIRLHEAD